VLYRVIERRRGMYGPSIKPSPPERSHRILAPPIHAPSVGLDARMELHRDPGLHTKARSRRSFLFGRREGRGRNYYSGPRGVLIDTLKSKELSKRAGPSVRPRGPNLRLVGHMCWG